MENLRGQKFSLAGSRGDGEEDGCQLCCVETAALHGCFELLHRNGFPCCTFSLSKTHMLATPQLIFKAHGAAIYTSPATMSSPCTHLHLFSVRLNTINPNCPTRHRSADPAELEVGREFFFLVRNRKGLPRPHDYAAGMFMWIVDSGK